MQNFPAVDPIPLPAPVWLMKLLHIVTLALHFIAVELLLGGLLIAILFSLLSSPSAKVAAKALARRLTVVMTFVINFGVPPLLFAQVLYGRALYTSSVLIGAYWISIIVLLTFAYWLLYVFTKRLELGKSAWHVGLLAWLICGSIAKILSTNMTLMLRPEVWRSMYDSSAAGVYLPTGDPTTTPRWILMLVGGFAISGLWLLWLAARSTFSVDEKKFLSVTGGAFAAVAGVAYLFAGLWAYSVQPDAVKIGLATHPLYHYFAMAQWLWILSVALVIAVGALAAMTRTGKAIFGWLAIVLALLVELSLVIFRDAVRDLTLLSKGYDVWDRVVVSNWGVIGIFLALFVGSLGVVAWLISVVARATKIQESEA